MDSCRLTLLIGEVNDRIYELLGSADPGLSTEFLCECGSGCDRRVSLLPTAFAALRRSGRTVRSPDCRRPRARARAQAGGSVPACG